MILSRTLCKCRTITTITRHIYHNNNNNFLHHHKTTTFSTNNNYQKRCFSFSIQNGKKIFKSGFLSVKVPELNFPEFLLDEALERHKELAAIDATQNETLTYGKVKEKVNDLAIQYYIRGWKQNEVLAVIMTNKLIFPLTFLGAARVGIPVTLVDPTLKSREMVKQLKICRASYIITTNELLPQVRDATASLRGIKEILVLDKEDEPKDKKEIRWSIEMKYNLLFGKPPGWGALPDWQINLTSPIVLSFTDRGLRGGVLNHRALSSTILSLGAIEKDVTANDVFISTVPFSNLFSLVISIFPFYKGAKTVVLENFEIARFLGLIQQHKITYAYLTKPQLVQLSETSLIDTFDISSLKVILLTDHVDLDLIQKVNKIIPNLKIKQGYGVPNLSPPVIFSPTSNIKQGSVGILLPETEAKLIDPVTNTELDVNFEGDLYIKGPQIMTEYINNQEATKVGFDNEQFLKTADRARVDEDGYWWVSPKIDPAATTTTTETTKT